MPGIVSVDLLEDELGAVVQAGRYASRDEAMAHALEVLLSGDAELRVGTAVSLYAEGKVTLSRAAEIAGLDLDGLKAELKARGLRIVVHESAEEVRAGAASIRNARQQR